MVVEGSGNGLIKVLCKLFLNGLRKIAIHLRIFGLTADI
jgi:hypothetical protein